MEVLQLVNLKATVQLILLILGQDLSVSIVNGQAVTALLTWTHSCIYVPGNQELMHHLSCFSRNIIYAVRAVCPPMSAQPPAACLGQPAIPSSLSFHPTAQHSKRVE